MMSESLVDSVVYEQMTTTNSACEDNEQTLLSWNDNEYEIMKSCNDLMAKLVNVLENIMFNLSKTVELMKQTHNITDTIQPFETDYNVWHELYCNIKCMLNVMQHKYDTISDTHMISSDCHYHNEEDVCLQEEGVCDDSESVNANTYKQVMIESWNELIHKNSGHSNDDEVLLNDCSDERNNSNDSDVNYNESKSINKSKVNTKRKMTEKFEIINAKRRYVCEWNECLYRTDNNANFRKHCRVHTGEKPYKCDFNACNYSCSDRTQYLSHRNHYHSQLRQYWCDWPQCSARLKTAKNLRSHIRAKHTHERPHTCEWPGCDKAFMSPFEREYHKLSHTGDRPFNCDIFTCNRKFSRSSTLTRHKRVAHSAHRKQFHCCHCKSKYSRDDDLKRHVKIKHNNIANSERDYSVESCISLMSEKSMLSEDKKIVIDLSVSNNRKKSCAQKS